MESALTGLNSYCGGYARWSLSNALLDGAAGYLIYRPEDWLFKDTGLSWGTSGKGCRYQFELEIACPGENDDGPASMQMASTRLMISGPRMRPD